MRALFSIATIISIVLIVRCSKDIIDIPRSDIGIELNAEEFLYYSGDTVTYYLEVRNYGPDIATNIGVYFKQASNNLRFIEPDTDKYDLSTGIITFDTINTTTKEIFIVKAIAEVPDFIPALQIQQCAIVEHNINYDGRSSNNWQCVQISLVP